MRKGTQKFLLPLAILLFFTTNLKAERIPVVLVHGWGVDCSLSFSGLRSHLENAGYMTFCLNFSNRIGSNIPNAFELSAFVDWIQSQTGFSQVDFVTHSMGGLSTRFYIKYLGGQEKVRSVIELGCPNHGTLSAFLVFGFSEGGREMVPDSEFLRDLNSEEEAPPPVNWTSIYSLFDEIILPTVSSELQGARNRLVWRPVGHFGLLLDSTVRRWIVEGLMSPE